MPTGALRSVHTSNLPELFDQLRISLAASTYQAGKVIVIRSDQGVMARVGEALEQWIC